ncbi:MAG: DUF4238 domain-containing protein [Bradyrhizobium sp.]|nr:DUF4238 domain-containing protein [Bradyrhizobium sp.]
MSRFATELPTVTTARAHHYVPQCYLIGFAREGKITVVDVKTGKGPFATNPKNVAQERDFNRIDGADLPADALENAYGAFEGELAPVLKGLIAGERCGEEQFEYVLSLVGVLALRNPRYRASFSGFQNSVRHQMLAVALSSKERWEKQLARMRADGYLQGKPDVPYETLKEHLAKGDIRFVTTTSEHARAELHSLEVITEVLTRRRWRWVRANKDSGGFITCDHPVCLNWIKRPRGFAPLGYGLTGTTVYFPLSPDLAILGEFGGPTDDVWADAYMAGDFNRRVLNNTERQAFVSDGFKVFDGVNLFGIDELMRRARAVQNTSQGP